MKENTLNLGTVALLSGAGAIGSWTFGTLGALLTPLACGLILLWLNRRSGFVGQPGAKNRPPQTFYVDELTAELREQMIRDAETHKAGR